MGMAQDCAARAAIRGPARKLARIRFRCSGSAAAMCGRCRAWRAASHYGCGAGESGRGMVVMVLALNGCADPAIVAVA
ncbi:protein of unknown function [Cupriavidus taiwanensis]|nr:hypothetical protein CBM2585_B130041 [Cupriavidus taiwanensis]SOZ08411.1 protein of unknown function [Cupriavidus taiwanensis]SOZ13203.1 protein of unknown function [Cupriavidus taiwanensis]SOZ41923.1 protein of unknown function [Cupriavidus taiwanensis]